MVLYKHSFSIHLNLFRSVITGLFDKTVYSIRSWQSVCPSGRFVFTFIGNEWEFPVTQSYVFGVVITLDFIFREKESGGIVCFGGGWEREKREKERKNTTILLLSGSFLLSSWDIARLKQELGLCAWSTTNQVITRIQPRTKPSTLILESEILANRSHTDTVLDFFKFQQPILLCLNLQLPNNTGCWMFFMCVCQLHSPAYWL